MEGIRAERGLLGFREGSRFIGSWGRVSCSRKRGLLQRDLEHRYGGWGWGGGECQTEDRGRLGGRGTPVGTPRNRGLHQVSWERDPVPRWKRGGRIGRHPCRTNEQQLPKSKMPMCPQKKQTKPLLESILQRQ